MLVLWNSKIKFYGFFQVVTKAVICLHVMGAWEDLQMIIARSTIEDFIAIVQKLTQFLNIDIKMCQHHDKNCLFVF